MTTQVHTHEFRSRYPVPIHVLIITRLRLLDAAAREVGKLCQAMAPLHLCICLHNMFPCVS